MNYIELRISCRPDFREILMAEIGALGFDGMIETDKGFMAYINEEKFEESSLMYLLDRYDTKADLLWDIKTIARKNWNKEWEKNFKPVIIGNQCAIRASFHKPITHVPYEIIIDPKMSFGTGHHETTSLMIRLQLELDHSGKKVLDCGCGTGILSIMASKLNAGFVTGFDIDNWAVSNSIDNAILNGVVNIKFLHGNIHEAGISGKFDIIFANINKNVLLKEIPDYSTFLVVGGRLLLSGFFPSDLQEIRKQANINGLGFIKSLKENDWVAAVFLKK